MWIYDNVTRDDFEKRKAFVEQIILNSGGKPVDIELSYERKTTSVTDSFSETHYSDRTIFIFNNEYFRVDEVLFKSKPFIVLEYGTYKDLINNTMEDSDPIPFDLSDNEITDEIKYLLGIE